MIANRDIQFLYPDLKVRLFRLRSSMNELLNSKIEDDPSLKGVITTGVFLVEGYRSHERQKDLYDQGRILPGKIVTQSKPGDSWHQYGLAIDLAFSCKGDPYAEAHPWSDLIRLAEATGFESGSHFLHPDRPHFQLRYGLSLDQVKQLYKVNGLTAVWAAIDKIRGLDPGVGWTLS